MNFVTFKELWKTNLVLYGLIWNSIVSYKRIGEHENLSTVGRISEGLGVSNHTSIENNLSGDRDVCSEGLSYDGVGAIGKVEYGIIALLIKAGCIIRHLFGKNKSMK